VGASDSEFGIVGFRWMEATGMVQLAGLGPGSLASGVSGDGSVVVGYYYAGSNQVAFRWTETDGVSGLGDLPEPPFGSVATGISDDGLVIVGAGTVASGTQAFRWTQADGMVGLGYLPGGGAECNAQFASADGSVIVGSSDTTDSFSQAFRWTQAEGMVALGHTPAGDFVNAAFGVSGDGSVIVGFALGELGPAAVIWDAASGLRNLHDVLVNDYGLGDVLAGWTLETANGVSADGSSIVGDGINPSGGVEGWLARLGTPGVTIVSANPPADNPWVDGMQPFRDPLRPSFGPTLTLGIGGIQTPPLGGIIYAPISVTFSAAPDPPPSIDNVTVSCTPSSYVCPSVTNVTGSGAGPFEISLSNPIPPGECTTLTFAGTSPGAKLQYEYLPGDVNLNGVTSTQDLLGLIQALNNGQANEQPARYNINRDGATNTQDLIGLLKILNGSLVVQSFNGVTVADCP